MKKTFLYSAFLFFCIIFYTNISFAQRKTTTQITAEQEKTNKAFIGKWWNGMEMGGITLNITADGSYVVTEDMQDSEVEVGKWSAEKNMLTLVSNQKNKTILHYVTNANKEGRNKIALRGKGCAVMGGFCYFRIE